VVVLACLARNLITSRQGHNRSSKVPVIQFVATNSFTIIYIWPLLAPTGTIKRGIVSYSLSPDVSVIRLHVDQKDDLSHLPEGVTSHTQSVVLLLPEGMSSRDFAAGARMRVSGRG
jgi:hypothetical protein